MGDAGDLLDFAHAGRRQHPRRLILGVVVGLALMLAVVSVLLIVLSTVRDEDGKLLIDNTAGLIGAALSASSIPAVLLGVAVTNVSHQNRSILRNVQNDHRKPDGTPLGMRDDNDQKHDELVTMVRGLSRDLHDVRDDIKGLRRDVGRLTDVQQEHTRQITDIRIDRATAHTKG